jgi:hypothetical protein
MEATEEYTSDDDSTSYDITKIPTTTKVAVLNNTARFASIDVVVKGDDGKTVTDGIVRVIVRGTTKELQLNGNNNLTFFLGDVLDVPSGEDGFSLEVEYLGNGTYLPSSGVNASNVTQNITNITIIPETVTLTIELTNPVYVHDTQTIHGVLLDGENLPLAQKVLTVTIIDENNVEDTHHVKQTMMENTL